MRLLLGTEPHLAPGSKVFGPFGSHWDDVDMGYVIVIQGLKVGLPVYAVHLGPGDIAPPVLMNHWQECCSWQYSKKNRRHPFSPSRRLLPSALKKYSSSGEPPGPTGPAAPAGLAPCRRLPLLSCSLPGLWARSRLCTTEGFECSSALAPLLSGSVGSA